MFSGEQKVPRVAVYIPTKNRCELLRRAIESVFAQTMPDWELIVADDGSTDGTPAMMAELCALRKNVRYMRSETSQGACAARNRAVEAATAPLVTGLDDDDEFTTDRLEAMLAAHTPDCAFVFAGLNIFTDGRSAGTRIICRDLTAYDFLWYNSGINQILVEKAKLLEVGGYDPQMPASQDWDTWTRLTLRFGRARHVPLALMNYYQEKSRPTITNNRKGADAWSRFFEKHQHAMTAAQRWYRLYRNAKVLGERHTLMQCYGSVMFKLYYFRLRRYIVKT